MKEYDTISVAVYDTCLPDNTVMASGILYVSRKYQTCKHLCPCGCGAVVVTPIDKPYGWSFELEEGKPTLVPSIGNFNLACKSHYCIKDGKIVWA